MSFRWWHYVLLVENSYLRPYSIISYESELSETLLDSLRPPESLPSWAENNIVNRIFLSFSPPNNERTIYFIWTTYKVAKWEPLLVMSSMSPARNKIAFSVSIHHQSIDEFKINAQTKIDNLSLFLTWLDSSSCWFSPWISCPDCCSWDCGDHWRWVTMGSHSWETHLHMNQEEV